MYNLTTLHSLLVCIQRHVIDAVVAIFLIGAAGTPLQFASVATAMSPAQSSLRRYLLAVGYHADTTATVRPAVAVALRLACAPLRRARLEASVLEAELVQFGTVRTALDLAARASAVTYATASRHRNVLASFHLTRWVAVLSDAFPSRFRIGFGLVIRQSLFNRSFWLISRFFVTGVATTTATGTASLAQGC